MADILIVEDKESLRTMLRTTLESRGYAVDEAGDAEQARRKLAAFRYLVVLTDLKLPVGSGLDVLQAALDADAETPVVMMTAFGTVEEAVRAMKQGAADFLTKPVDTDHLLLLLDRTVETRRVATELVILKEDYQRRYGLPRVLGEDPVLKEAMPSHARRHAATVPVGEAPARLMRRARSTSCRGGPRGLAQLRRDRTTCSNELFGERAPPGRRAQDRHVSSPLGTLFLDRRHAAAQADPEAGAEKQFERVGGLSTLSVDSGWWPPPTATCARSWSRSSSARTSSSACP